MSHPQAGRNGAAPTAVSNETRASEAQEAGGREQQVCNGDEAGGDEAGGDETGVAGASSTREEPAEQAPANRQRRLLLSAPDIVGGTSGVGRVAVGDLGRRSPATSGAATEVATADLIARQSQSRVGLHHLLGTSPGRPGGSATAPPPRTPSISGDAANFSLSDGGGALAARLLRSGIDSMDLYTERHADESFSSFRSLD